MHTLTGLDTILQALHGGLRHSIRYSQHSGVCTYIHVYLPNAERVPKLVLELEKTVSFIVFQRTQCRYTHERDGITDRVLCVI